MTKNEQTVSPQQLDKKSYQSWWVDLGAYLAHMVRCAQIIEPSLNRQDARELPQLSLSEQSEQELAQLDEFATIDPSLQRMLVTFHQHLEALKVTIDFHLHSQELNEQQAKNKAIIESFRINTFWRSSLREIYNWCYPADTESVTSIKEVQAVAAAQICKQLVMKFIEALRHKEVTDPKLSQDTIFNRLQAGVLSEFAVYASLSKIFGEEVIHFASQEEDFQGIDYWQRDFSVPLDKKIVFQVKSNARLTDISVVEIKSPTDSLDKNTDPEGKLKILTRHAAVQTVLLISLPRKLHDSTHGQEQLYHPDTGWPLNALTEILAERMAKYVTIPSR